MGPEEDARVILAAMFDRIVRGPAAALDIEPDAAAAEIRAAFHALAKQYHPARFGRMSHETQRLANEVFLGLRLAHDTLMKSQAGRQTTAIGVGMPRRMPGETEPPTTGQTGVRTTQSLPPLRPSQPLPMPPRQTGAVPLQRPAVAPTTNHGTQPLQRPAAAAGTAPRPLPAAPRVPTAPPGRTSQSGAIPVQPAGARQTQQAPVVGRTPTQPRTLAPEGARIGGTRPPGASPRLTSAIELLHRGQWDLARTALTSLAQESPESNQLRALLAYATGRQAQVERRLDEARVELNRALQFDPDLALAKTALAELFARRK